MAKAPMRDRRGLLAPGRKLAIASVAGGPWQGLQADAGAEPQQSGCSPDPLFCQSGRNHRAQAAAALDHLGCRGSH